MYWKWPPCITVFDHCWMIVLSQCLSLEMLFPFQGSLHFCQCSCHDYQLQISISNTNNNIEKTKRFWRTESFFDLRNTYFKSRWLLLVVIFSRSKQSVDSIFREPLSLYCGAIRQLRPLSLVGGPISGLLLNKQTYHC